jgi:hypothetical protein
VTDITGATAFSLQATANAVPKAMKNWLRICK